MIEYLLSITRQQYLILPGPVIYLPSIIRWHYILTPHLVVHFTNIMRLQYKLTSQTCRIFTKHRMAAKIRLAEYIFLSRTRWQYILTPGPSSVRIITKHNEMAVYWHRILTTHVLRWQYIYQAQRNGSMYWHQRLPLYLFSIRNMHYSVRDTRICIILFSDDSDQYHTSNRTFGSHISYSTISMNTVVVWNISGCVEIRTEAGSSGIHLLRTEIIFISTIIAWMEDCLLQIQLNISLNKNTAQNDRINKGKTHIKNSLNVICFAISGTALESLFFSSRRTNHVNRRILPSRHKKTFDKDKINVPEI